MNTTNAEIAKIDDFQFGELVNLPALAKAHKLSADNAKLATDKYLKPFEDIGDLSKADVTTVEAVLVPIRALRVKLDATEKKINGERSPHTQKMTQIASVLIANEKAVRDEFLRCKKADDDWQLELIRRNKVNADAAAAKLKAEQDKIERKAKIATAINAQFGSDLTTRIVDMHKKFYSFDNADALKAWIEKMRTWIPIYNPLTLTNAIEGDAAEIQEVKNSLVPGFLKEYDARCTAERDNLVDMLPGRLDQLYIGAGAAEVVVDVDRFASTIMGAVADMNQAVQDDAQKASINASFDSAAVPIESSAVGKRVKKKYKADTMEALRAIMQSWAQHNMRLLTIEELNKKLSFMRTAADVRLNEGSPVLEAKGLSVVDDVSTRTAKA